MTRAASLVTPLTLALAWEVAVRAGAGRGLIPPPSEALRALFEWVFDTTSDGLASYRGGWTSAAWTSLLRVGLGFASGVGMGVPVGLLIGTTRVGAALLNAPVQFLRPVPVAAWLPLSIILLGIGGVQAVFIIGLAAFFPVAVTAASGSASIPREYWRATRMLGLPPRARLSRMVLPASAPAIFAGLRLSLSASWTALVIAEMVCVKSGLGYVLWEAYYVGRMDVVVADMISIGLLGYLSDRLLAMLEQRAAGWRLRDAG